MCDCREQKVHDSHCCSSCGCKYGDPYCPVSDGILCDDCKTKPTDRVEQTYKAVAEQLQTELDQMRKSEHQTSDAYVRLRVILGALDTPHAPAPEQIHELTESKAKGLKTELDQMTARVAELESALDEKDDVLTTCVCCGSFAAETPMRDIADQLKARVARLEEFLNKQAIPALHLAKTDYPESSMAAMRVTDARALMRETPAQSLSAIKADVLREFRNWCLMETDIRSFHDAMESLNVVPTNYKPQHYARVRR